MRKSRSISPFSYEKERWSSGTFSIQLSGVEEALKSFSPEIVERALKSSLVRVAASGKAFISEQIRAIYNVKKADLDPRIVTALRIADHEADIVLSGRSISLPYFGAKQLMGTRTRQKVGKQLVTKRLRKSAGPMPVGVVVEIKRGSPVLLRNVFMAQMKSSGHIGVWRRLSKVRTDIEEKAVVTFATMLKNPGVMPAVQQHIADRWEQDFWHNLEYFAGKGDAL